MVTDGTVTHVRLLVDEYAATFEFYRDVIGLSAAFGDAESGYADLGTGDVTLALFDASEMAAAVDGEHPPDPDGGQSVRGNDPADVGDREDVGGRTPAADRAVVVLRIEDVDDTAATLREHGVALAAPPTDHPEWGIRTVHCRDPDGTLVEFNEPLEH